MAPTSVNSGGVNGTPTQGDRSRKSSVAMSEVGTSYPNRGPVAKGRAPSNLTFGSFGSPGSPGSPAASNVVPQPLEAKNLQVLDVQTLNPRVNTPVNGPSPSPTPNLGGGKPDTLPTRPDLPMYGPRGLNAQLHDQLFQQYQQLEIAPNSLRTQLAAQQRAEQAWQVQAAHNRGPSSTMPPQPNSLPQAQHLHREPSQSAHSNMSNRDISGPNRYDPGSFNPNPPRGPQSPSSSIFANPPTPTFTIPPKTSKAIVIKNAHGEVVEFKKKVDFDFKQKNPSPAPLAQPRSPRAPSTAGSSHSRTESIAAKTHKEKLAKFKAQLVENSNKEREEARARAKAEAKIKEAQAEAKEAEAKIKKAQAEAKKAEAKIKEAEAKIKEAKAKVKEAEAEAKEAKEAEAKIKEIEAEAKEAEAEAKEAEAEAKEAEAKAKEVEAEAKEAEAEAEAKKAEAKKAEAKLKEAEAKVQEAEAEAKKAAAVKRMIAEMEAKEKVEEEREERFLEEKKRTAEEAKAKGAERAKAKEDAGGLEAQTRTAQPPTQTSGVGSASSSQPPPPQQRTMVMPDRMRWIYLDHYGNTQGPFSGLEMHDWYRAGFFPHELLVKKQEDVDYKPLSQFIRRIGNSREPFLVPQIGIPHGPPTTQPDNAFDTLFVAPKYIEHNVLFAVSSKDDSSNTFRSSSVLRTESTIPTSVSGEGLPGKNFHKAQIAQSYINEEEPQEDSDHTNPPFDGQSTISADSVVVLTAKQRNDVVEKFSKALLRNLPSKCFASDNENVDISAFHLSFSRSVKAYSKKAMVNAERRSRRRQASKAIRFLRNEIIQKCYESLGGFTHSERRHIPSIVHKLGPHDIRGKTAAEKVNEWSAHLLDLSGGVLSDPTSAMFPPRVNGNDNNIPLDVGQPADDKPASDVCNLSDTTTQSLSHISQLSYDEDDNIRAEDQDVYTYLTEHSAFSGLVDELRALVERHFCNQKELIHHRILLAIRRPGIIEQFSDGIFQASFYIDWDVLDFLQTCYSLSQDLRHVIALTGTPVNAQLATVEMYLQQTWPDHTFKLVDALNTAISATIQGVADKPDQRYAQQIHISMEERKISVRGTEDLLVAVGQQLAWLGAACRDSPGQLAHCYTSFTDIKSTGPGLPELKFEIKYEVTSLDSGEPTSCWNDLVGDSVVVAGFPFAQRDSSAIGLEVPLQIMATIADIPLATFYRGGYVLKGRSIVFVPVKRGVDFVQWHLHKQSTGRISYQDIRSMFPDRLLVRELDENDLLSARSFLGWCPMSSNDLASGAYNYQAISYTKTPYLSKKALSLTGASIGFQQFAAGSLNFAISKRGRMHRIEKAQYYKDLLDAAKQIPVVLQDMEDRRAWYTDGERVILHVILHRHALKPFEANGPVQLASASPNDPASLRQAMMVNADTLVSLDRDMGRPGIRPKSFKDLVHELYTELEGLMAEMVDIADAGIALNLDWKKHIQGWEYMDLVNRKLTPRPRETELKSTCGKWPELARDRNAVVLFGNRLQNIISPHPSLRLCRLFKELPKQKDYLAVESEKIENMYVESGAADDRTQITLTGLQLHRSQHLFEVCPRATFRADHCKCERIQQLVPRRAIGKVIPLPKMNATGAVIIGQGNTSWINELSHTWVALRRTSQHQPVDSHSRAPDPPQPTRGASVVDFYLPQPGNPNSVSGSRSSLDTRSLPTTTASTKATTMMSDTSSARSLGFGRVSASNFTKSPAKSPAKTPREISGVPWREPGCLPNTSSAGTVPLNSKASLPDKHDRPSQLQPNGFGSSVLGAPPTMMAFNFPRSITRHPEKAPEYDMMAHRSKYPRDNTPVLAQTTTRPCPPRQPVLKSLPENDGMNMLSMSPPRLRRKPNFPLVQSLNVPPSA